MHLHLLGDHPESLALLEELDLKVVNIAVSRDEAGKWREMAGGFRDLAHRYPRRYAWCTSFDMPRWDDPRYAEATIAAVEEDFAAGAVAVKVWKNVGMDLRHPDGHHVMIDEPVFEPLLRHLEATGRTLLMHLAEPLACWQALTPDNPHYHYYSRFPEWHRHGRRNCPTHADILAARDRAMERHPGLRFIGAHLGSMEHDVDEIARRLERHPNFVVDTSARINDLALQDRTKVREFFLRWQDRVLFGTDLVSMKRHGELTDEERRAALATIRERYRTSFAFFETDDTFLHRGRQVRGIALPPEVLEKLYVTNTRRWLPRV